MKLTKIFGIVLSLHVVVILLVMFQPGCQTVDDSKPVTNQSSGTEDPPAVKPPFNQGLPDPTPSNPGDQGETTNSGLSAPTRPDPGGIIVPGFNPSPETPGALNLTPANVSVYKVQRGDTLWAIARKHSITLSGLLSANPNLDKNSRLAIDQEIILLLGGSTDSGELVDPAQVPTVSQGDFYLVKSGDSLIRIAQAHGVSLESLIQANGLSEKSIIRPGQNLIIPEGGSSSAVPSAPSLIVPPGASTHTVKRGDNLSRISAIYGMTVKQIMEWNGLSDSGKIQIGQSLIVSESGSGATAPPPSKPEGAVPSDQDSSVQDFFKGKVEDRPVVDVKEE
jgi:LysM repeat protein